MSIDRSKKRMYKKGKSWVVATTGVVVASTIVGFSTVSADEVDSSSSTDATTDTAAQDTETTVSNEEQAPATLQPQVGDTSPSNGSVLNSSSSVTSSTGSDASQAASESNVTSDTNQPTSENKGSTDTAVTSHEMTTPTVPNQAESDSTAVITPEVKEALSNVPSVKESNGKLYYYDSNNEIKKDFVIELNGQVYYFGKDGALVDSNSVEYKEGLSSLNNPHNEFFDKNSKDITTVDGFLVADSWYRPKDILRDGVKWEPSTENDSRPLLMMWWPDKQTQVDYVNYMTKQGLGDTSSYHFTTEDSQESLTNATNLIQAKIEAKISSPIVKSSATNYSSKIVAIF